MSKIQLRQFISVSGRIIWGSFTGAWRIYIPGSPVTWLTGWWWQIAGSSAQPKVSTWASSWLLDPPSARWLASKSNHPKRNRRRLFRLLWLYLETHCNYKYTQIKRKKHKPELFMGKSSSSAISSSAIPFSSCLRPFPESGFFPVNRYFTSGGQSIGVTASASVLPMNTQDWSPLGWTGWISLLSKGLSRVFSNATIQKHQFFGAQLSLWSNSHIHTCLLEKQQLWLDGFLSAK